MKKDFPDKVKSEVRHRSGGMCEAQTPVCKGRASVFHHVLLRSHGGKGRADNCLHLCNPCHLFIHSNPRVSYELGWMKRSGPLVVDIDGE